MTGAPDGRQALTILPVRAEVWGATPHDVQMAVASAKDAPSRRQWHFAQIDELAGPTCPIDVHNPPPHSLATDEGYGWAYAVYPVRTDG